MTQVFRDEKYRVMLIVQSLRVGGAETMVENLAYALRGKGCEVRVVALQAGETIITERLRQGGVPLTILGKRPGMDLSLIGHLAAEMMRFHPNVVHSHLPILHYVVPAANRAGVANVVHTLHSIASMEVKSKIKAAYCRRCYRSGRVRPVALSEINRQSVVERYGVDAGCVPVIPNGIDLSSFQARGSYAIDGVPHVAHIARFERAKNHMLLVECADLLRKRGEEVHFDLYGVGSLRESVEEVVAQRGLTDCFTFHGLTDDVPGALAQADVFMLPSEYEGIPMTIAEAMATGMPIVASKVGGIPDMVENGISAILCEPSAQNFADALESLILNEEQRAKLGMAAFGRSSEFSSDLMAERYLAIYHANGGRS